MNSSAESAERSATSHDGMSLLSAQRSTSSSRQLRPWLSFPGFAFAAFAPTNDQISSTLDALAGQVAERFILILGAGAASID
jgi:hypothetical protein